LTLCVLCQAYDLGDLFSRKFSSILNKKDPHNVLAKLRFDAVWDLLANVISLIKSKIIIILNFSFF